MDGRTLWTPSREAVEGANITRYARWLERRTGRSFVDYSSLWRWSTENIEEFWETIWEYFEVWSSTPYRAVLPERKMPGASWFGGAQLNYAEHVFRNRGDGDVALIAAGEGWEEDSHVTWGELKAETASLAAFLREEGVRPGDRVAGYLPNRPEAVVGLLASASIGAVWSCCSPEFGAPSVVDRFKQIAPKVFIGAEGYLYGGRWFDRRGVIEAVRDSVPSITTTIVTDAREKGVAGAEDWVELEERSERLEFAKVPFDHPLWVLYTSGTTGLPKPIVHGHGGMLLEQLKALSLHNDLRRGDRMFWYTSAGWMMWNYLVGALMLGSAVILFDGDPLHPDPGALWDLAERSKTTFFGAGASYFGAVAKSGFDPRGRHLRDLRGFGSTGSPLSAAGFEWFYSQVKDDLWVASISGGTDVCTAFVGGCPVLPVRSGRIQCRYLGAAVAAYDEGGRPVSGKVGELVLTEPMPSMPLFLWGDEDGSRYAESYFSSYPGVWRHGDWISIDEDGTCVIYGRSDATIKRRGIRAGTSEIYGVVESIPEVLDSLVVDLEYPGRSFMPLFVVLKQGERLDGALREKIRRKVGADLSPRMVPDDVVQIQEVPRTLNGKKVEVPVKRVLMGAEPEEVLSAGSLRNPEAMEFFADYRKVLKTAGASG